MSVKIVSLNVRGIREFSKRKAIFRFCRRQQADVILLQETHSTLEVERKWKTEWGGNIIFSHGTNNSRGTAILFHRKFKFHLNSIVKDTLGRFVYAEIGIDDLMIVIANFYAPNKEREQIEFLKSATAVFHANFPHSKVIVGGDINIMLDPIMDKRGDTLDTRNVFRSEIHKFIDTLNLVDIFRIRNPNTYRFTWRRGNSASRLDYFFIPSSFQKQVKHCDIIPSVKSDHDAITLTLEISTNRRGPGFWKFNCSLLEDVQYTQMMNTFITETIHENANLSDSALFDFLRYKIRDLTITYSKKKAKDRRDKERDLYH